MKTKNKNCIKKPWGCYVILEKRPKFWLKKLFINKGEETSLQSHKKRDEVWTVLKGKIRARKGRNVFVLKEGDQLRIKRKEKHRMLGLAKSIVLEEAFGHPKERDIIRYKDKYNRS